MTQQQQGLEAVEPRDAFYLQNAAQFFDLHVLTVDEWDSEGSVSHAPVKDPFRDTGRCESFGIL